MEKSLKEMTNAELAQEIEYNARQVQFGNDNLTSFTTQDEFAGYMADLDRSLELAIEQKRRTFNAKN